MAPTDANSTVIQFTIYHIYYELVLITNKSARVHRKFGTNRKTQKLRPGILKCGLFLFCCEDEATKGVGGRDDGGRFTVC